MIYSIKYSSPLGIIMLASDEHSLIGLWIEGQKYFAYTIKNRIVMERKLPILNDARIWLDKYFSGENPIISDLPLAPKGSEFRKIVWSILCKIPYGEVTTYGELTKRVAILMNKKNMSNRAVGGAIGHNPISIIIPCHRVVGANGSLVGYAGGIHTKFKLLEHEGADMSRFSLT